MGVSTSPNMKFFVAFTVLASVACAFSPNDVVPEQSSFAPQLAAIQTSSNSPHEAAVRAYRLLQQNGNDDAACRALANSMIAEVNTTVSTAQANIDAVDNGSDCGSRYQDEVTAAHTANTNAQNAVTEAQTALTTASSASVTLTQAYTVDPAVTYFTNNPAWVEAAGNYEQAQTALSTAQGTAATTATAYTTAQATQTTEINTCRCTAQSAHAAAVSNNANSNNAATNTANWNQAHNLLCVLDNTNPCNFAPAPTVTARPLPADVSGATCSGSPFASGRYTSTSGSHDDCTRTANEWHCTSPQHPSHANAVGHITGDNIAMFGLTGTWNSASNSISWSNGRTWTLA